MQLFFLNFVIIIKYSRAQDLGPGTWDTRPRAQDPGPKTQDSGPETPDRRCRTKNRDPGSDICNQVLGFIIHAVWTSLAIMIFIIQKYSYQINIDVNIIIFKLNIYFL